MARSKCSPMKKNGKKRKKEAARRYREMVNADPERLARKRAASKKFKELHPDRLVANMARFRALNPEKLAEYQRRYKSRHPGKALAYQRRYRALHPDKLAADQRRYYLKHKKRAAGPTDLLITGLTQDQLYLSISALVSRSLPAFDRDDIIQEVYLAALDGSMPLSEMKSAVPLFIKTHYRYGYIHLSIDAIKPGKDKERWIDNLASDVEHF
jgi:hypothetical protein